MNLFCGIETILGEFTRVAVSQTCEFVMPYLNKNKSVLTLRSRSNAAVD